MISTGPIQFLMPELTQRKQLAHSCRFFICYVLNLFDVSISYCSEVVAMYWTELQ